MTRRATSSAKEQRFAALLIPGGGGNRLLRRAQVCNDLPDLIGRELVRWHLGPRHAGADRASQIRIGAAMTPGPGGQIRTAHAAPSGKAMAEHAFLPEQHRTLRNGFRIAG